MGFCPSCGEQLSKGSDFCSGCGEKIRSEEAEKNVVVNANNPLIIRIRRPHLLETAQQMQMRRHRTLVKV